MKSIRKKYFLNIAGIFFYLFLFFMPFNVYAEKKDFNDQFQKIIKNYRYILGEDTLNENYQELKKIFLR